MKKLKKLLLIHWYTYSKEIIEFEDINFLTGKTASGKSTIIDAMQLVMLGETTGFFNKAANEKSVRNLKSYLYGENGDDGASGFEYLRTGPFTSCVAMEFYDTEQKTPFVIGFAADCYEDQNFDYNFFTISRNGMPEDLFIDPKTNVPCSRSQMKTMLTRTVGKKNFEFFTSNRRYQEVTLGKFGQIKRKYRTLFKKAVPFTPITDIERFITESICDVKNQINVEEMQSDIRQYKRLEGDAQRTQKRIDSLQEIQALSRQFESQRELLREQEYIVIRADKEELLTEKQNLQADAESRFAALQKLKAEISLYEEKIKSLEEKAREYEAKAASSDLAQTMDRLNREIAAFSEKIAALENGLRRAVNGFRTYGRNWKHAAEKISGTNLHFDRDRIAAGLEKMTGLTEENMASFPMEEEAVLLREFHEQIREYEYQLKMRLQQLGKDIALLEKKIADIKNGIKAFPPYVTVLKRKIEEALFKETNRAVQVEILSDVLEIRDESWRNAIEGYLDKQKFYLLVPEDCYQKALRIYDQAKKEERIYDAGLIDSRKLRKEFHKKPLEGSLAEEIETDHPQARAYIDYLLGNVMKCERTQDLNRYRIGITRTAMLYKGYVARKIHPRRYETPYIGRRSMQLQLERFQRELEEQGKEQEGLRSEYRIMRSAAALDVPESYEVENYRKAVKDAEKLPPLRTQKKETQEELDAIDFTWLTQMRDAAAECRKQVYELGKSRDEANRRQGNLESTQERVLQQDIPLCEERIARTERDIQERFDPEWIRETGEARFADAHGKERTVLSLKESYSRNITRTKNTMEKLRNERLNLRSRYNSEYTMPYDTAAEENTEYDRELEELSEIRLPEYIDKIKEAKQKAYEQFRDDFIAKMKSNIETVRQQIGELNDSLRQSVFGTDQYHFTISPRAEYRRYYDMITDEMLMDTGGWNIASQQFNEKYQTEIDELFQLLVLGDGDMTSEKREQYDKNVQKFTDYKTYLTFDLIVKNVDTGKEQRLSRTLMKKSGGETQIPFYISMLASFSQVCRIRSKKNNTVRLIILDEAFSKMDGERIQESIRLLRKFRLQAVFSAPTDKIPDIAPLVDRNIAVYKDKDHSFTRYFDPKDVDAELMEE